jgi:hypothetical protein
MTSSHLDPFYSFKRQKGALHSRRIQGHYKNRILFYEEEDSFAKGMVGRLGVPLQA